MTRAELEHENAELRAKLEKLEHENVVLTVALDHRGAEAAALYGDCLALRVALTEIRDVVKGLEQKFSQEADAE